MACFLRPRPPVPICSTFKARPSELKPKRVRTRFKRYLDESIEYLCQIELDSKRAGDEVPELEIELRLKLQKKLKSSARR